MTTFDWPSALFSTVLVFGGPLAVWLGLGHDSETERAPSQGWDDEPAVARHWFGEVAK